MKLSKESLMNETTKTPSSWKIRAVIVAAWTAFCGLLTVMFLLPVITIQPDPGVSAEAHATALGASMTCATGCMGSVWFAGLVIGLVIYALVRR